MRQTQYTWLYVISVAIAIIFALFPIVTPRTIATVLAILGVIIGLVSITIKEANEFLIASVALIVAGLASKGLENIALIGAYIPAILFNLISLVAPAAIVVALKELNKVAREK